MATSKIINSIKIESSDFGKILKVDAIGNVTPVNITQEYIPLTGGTLDLTQDSIAEYVYNVDEFVGVGLDTDNISSVKVIVYCGDSGNSGTGSEIYALIGGTSYLIGFAQTNSSGSQDRDTNVLDIPIAAGETTVTITILKRGNLGASFTIAGANQLVIS
jgi:hypothetical protein